MNQASNEPVRVDHYLALGTSILLNTAALLLIRLVVAQIRKSHDQLDALLILGALQSPVFWAGVASFVGGIYFWMVSLRALDLSLAYPTSALSYVAIAVLSRLWFGEELSVWRVVGITAIVLGVAALYWHPKQSGSA